ncbi:MAG: hypothetical protein JWQ25_459 [Daejeonella sp.]|nr:hypothetical protein [Daejeonella sp.]
MKRYKTIRIVIICLFLGYLAHKYVNIGLKFAEVSSNHLGLDTIAQKDYWELFGKMNRHKAIIGYSYLNKKKYPASTFHYEDSLALIIYKIDSSNYLPLKDLITTTLHGVYKSEIVYTTVFQPHFDMYCDISSEREKISQIVITYDTRPLITLIKNDSTCFYRGNLGELSLSYGNKGDVDLVMSPVSKFLTKTKIIPVEFGFINKKGQLYFLIVSSRENNSLERGVLKRIFMTE